MVNYPDWLDLKLWREYKKMRKLIKKPMTEYAENLAIKKLANFMVNGHSYEQILEQSILNSWQGLFEVKNGQSFGTNKTSGELYREKLDDLAREEIRANGMPPDFIGE